MKLAAGRVAAFLQDPGGCRVALLHGDDAGLIRERGAALVRAVAGSLDDAFRVSNLGRDGLARLAEEASARSLLGGRRVVRVHDVGEAALAPVHAVLAGQGDALVVLEAGELQGRSRLKAVVEAADGAVAIACHAEHGADLARTIAGVLASHGLRASREAGIYLGEHLGNDRCCTRQELEKLALYVYPETEVTLDAVCATVGDLAGLQMEDALDAAIRGDADHAGRALDLALESGVSAVSVLRGLLGQMQKLDRIQVAIGEGQSAADAVRGQRPPIFFRRQPAFIAAASLWDARAVAGASRMAFSLETACKQTGAPDVTLCRQAVLETARMAARQSTRRRTDPAV